MNKISHYEKGEQLNKFENIENKYDILLNGKEKKMLERKNDLMTHFLDNKLEYKEYGDCYLYVKYGKPPIDEIIENEKKKIRIKNKRRIKLAEKLSERNIDFDENNKLCHDYINNIGCNGLHDTIRLIEIENYTNKNNNKKNKENKITISFD